MQISGTLSVYRIISPALFLPSSDLLLYPMSLCLCVPSLGCCACSERPQRHTTSCLIHLYHNPSQFSSLLWWCHLYVTAQWLRMSVAFSWLEAESFMVNCPRLSSLSHFKAQICKCVVALHKCMYGKEIWNSVLSTCEFYVVQFEYLYSWGKGNGSALAMGLDPHFHIRAGCSGAYPNLSLKPV